eukprot:2574845-Prymnesium_polylepis.1
MRGTDATTLALVAEQTNAHSGCVYSVGFSPDGTRIVSGSGDNSVKVWGGPRSLSLWSRVLVVAICVRRTAAEVCGACYAAQMQPR